MRIVVNEKTKQVVFEPSVNFFGNSVHQNMQDDDDFKNGIKTEKSQNNYIKHHANMKTTRKEQTEYFHQKRDEMLPYRITVDMPFDVYWGTEQWIIDTLSGGMWARKYEGRQFDPTNTASSPPDQKRATFWFENEKDRIVFKLMYG